MVTHTTEAGTAVIEMTPDEYSDFLEQEVQLSLGMSVDAFRDRAARGEVDWSDPDNFYVAGVLGMGQNGH